MTKKDFKIIADVLNSHKRYFPAREFETMCYTMAATLGGVHANFVEDKFITACGIKRS